MAMKKRILFLLLAVLCLSGCQTREPVPPTIAREVVEAEATPARLAVYRGAVKQYLGNGLDFSWEQEFPPEYVMLHFCSAVVDHPEDPYKMEYVRQTFIDADVSIHYIIDRDGTVYCYVPEYRTAWHAGVGQWKNDEKYTNKMNLYSIGIELVGIGSQEDMSLYLTKKEYAALDESLLGFTDAQYTALKALVTDICQRNAIPMDREHIIGHEEFNPKKNDPGELFDWSRILP
jgi:N-acetyl-anhydromuramyl-L-alanine amidase AmpD